MVLSKHLVFIRRLEYSLEKNEKSYSLQSQNLSCPGVEMEKIPGVVVVHKKWASNCHKAPYKS